MTRRPVLALLALGLALRVVWAVVHPVEPVSDFAHYSDYAATLAEHGVYGGHPDVPSAYWPPGWPALLALVYLAAGVEPELGGVLGAVLDWGAIVVAAAVAVRLLAPPFALAAVAAMCLYPGSILFGPVLASEHLTALLFTGLVAVLALTRPTVRTAAAAGLLEGALLLTRGDYGVPALIVVAAWLALGLPRLRLAPVAAVTAAALLLVTAPWIVRNAITFGEFIPTGTNGGINFYLGTLSPHYTSPPLVRRLGFTDAEKPRAHENRYYRRGLDNVADDPLRWLGYDATRLFLAYARESYVLNWTEVDARAVRWGASLYWLAIVGLALVGLGVIAARRRELPPAWLPIAVSLVLVTVLKLAYLDAARTRLPLAYLLIVVAGLGAQTLSGELRGRGASGRSDRGPRARPASARRST